MKFSRRKFSGLDGVTYEEFELQEAPTDKPLRLLASKAGVTIKGEANISSFEDLQEFAQVMSTAWTSAQKLTPKLTADIPAGLV